MSKLKVTLRRSVIGATGRQKANIEALGLKKVNDCKVVENKPEIKGMLDRVQHLLEIQDA